MELNESAKLRNILLDHYETPINVTLRTPSQLKNHYNGTGSNKSSPANSSHIKKMEDYITEKYDEIALDHLRSKILKEVTHKFEEQLNLTKFNRPSISETIGLLKSHIETLESEVYFLRDEFREKNVTIKSLMTSDFWSSKTSQHTKPPNDAYSNLGNNKNNKSVLNEPPEKDPTVDFHVECNNILHQNENHRVLPDSDEELDIITSISDKKSSIEIVNKQKEQPVKAQGTINKEIENLSSQQKKSDEKRVFIVGDSIIKNVNGYDVTGKTEQCRVYIRPSLDAKVRFMEDYIKPVIRDNPDHVIFHIVTNDVPSDKSAEDIDCRLSN